MAEQSAERRLSAIFAADVAGYSRLMGADEEGTLASLTGHRRDLFDPAIARHRGRIVKTTGDGLLAEFASVVDAVRCAVEVQTGMAARNTGLDPERRLEFRIGINVGDVVAQDGDIFGDGVNIAARLEGIAEPGGICVSARVYELAGGNVSATFEDIGEQSLKNIARPVQAYRIRNEGDGINPARPLALRLPDRPSIAVLPFRNMSGDPEQEYFADGMVEEIITALSRTRWLFVIARNSSFTYKGRAVDVKSVGRELGVRYVVEGSVRKAGANVRISGQLIDTTTGTHLWAEHFDGDLEDIFSLQDRVTESVVGAIAPTLEQAEIQRAKRKPTGSLDAYDYYLRGLAAVHHPSEETVAEARRLFLKAIDLDPDFAAAHAMAGFCSVWRKTNGWMTDPTAEIAEAERLARRAVELGKDDAVALARAGHTLAYVVGNLEVGASLIELALTLNPNFAAGWYSSGWVQAYLGNADTAIEHLNHAIRLSPLDPEINHMQTGMAFGHFLAGRYDEASVWAQKALRERPNYRTALRFAAASSALAGRTEEARQMITLMRRLDPALRLSGLRDRLPMRPADLDRLAEGLRLAGLPE